jgi:ribosomal-protein-alanine N-acetyltransferase
VLCAVAVDDLNPADILGFAIVRNVRVADEAALHIITIDVDPAARRSGTGRRLMQWMEERARTLGSRSMRLEVSETNEAAQRFYEDAGFKVTSRIPGYYAPSHDALVMERGLAKEY